MVMLAWRNYYTSLNDYLWQFPQSCDKHMTQTVSKIVYAMINFGIQNQGENFDQVMHSTKLHSMKWRFDEVTLRRKL